MSGKRRGQLFPRRWQKITSVRLDSILRGRDRNIAENYDNVNTISTQRLLAQNYIWATASVVIILQYAGETSVRTDIVYVNHVFVASEYFHR